MSSHLRPPPGPECPSRASSLTMPPPSGSAKGDAAKQIASIVLSLAVATASTWLMSRLLRMLDPTRPDARAVARKKREISERLGRPNVTTNSFEDVIALDVVRERESERDGQRE